MKNRRTPSLKVQIVGTLLLYWLIPLTIILGIMGWYISNSLVRSTVENLNDQLTVNVRMCADRLDSAVAGSRTASSDDTIKTAWAAYENGGTWAELYRDISEFLNAYYPDDPRFRYVAFYCTENPNFMRAGIHNEQLGVRFSHLKSFWKDSYPEVFEKASELDTGICFLQENGELFLVRNVLAPDYTTIGTLVMALNPDYYFGNLAMLPFSETISVGLEEVEMVILGAADTVPQGKILTAHSQAREYNLVTTIYTDEAKIEAQFESYGLSLIVMCLLLLAMLVYILEFHNRKISGPVYSLMESARKVEEGALGYQMESHTLSREFEYLTDSFNSMSGRLRNQFDRLYQEELALRDAKIKALQSHINPHFLNNTLEIINWEARMNGNVKVSKMIEALTTMLDAAIARDKRPEVLLSEEMGYVNAYLYIVEQRFGKRLVVELDIAEETLECAVPRLILQPVIENAVEHGIRPGGTGMIRISSGMEGDLLVIDVSNDGELTPEDEARIHHLLSPDYDYASEPERNLGISNVNQRLRILYGAPSGLGVRLEGDRVIFSLIIRQESDS